MKNLLFALLALFIISCSDEQNLENDIPSQSLTEKTELLQFKDWDAFFEQYDAISNLPQEDLKLWALEKEHNALLLSLYNEEDLSVQKENDLNTLTNGLLAILNSDQEFQVGENTIYFTDGSFYEVPQTSKNKNYKDATSNLKKVGEAGAQTSLVDNNGKTLTFNAGTGTIRIEGKEFRRKSWTRCADGYRTLGTCCTTKYAHQLTNRTINIFQYNLRSQVYLDVNMGYYYKGRWRRSGEDRNITINLQTSGILFFDNGFPTGPNNNFGGSLNRTISCVTTDQRIPLGEASYSVALGGYGVWHVNITGKITQHINGDDITNKWNHTVNWN
ncbi:hypothetical protein GCM10009430_38050 [Aquimarina litoralis]|uniref:Uncharacterized protein n=1 Tax=Aquimarina litoralis TaxID=584605 RepID=A0ABP3UAK8_9FLAO